MENYKIEEDIEVVFLTSPDFPNNVPATYKKLHALLADHPNRRYFGIFQKQCRCNCYPENDSQCTMPQNFLFQL